MSAHERGMTTTLHSPALRANDAPTAIQTKQECELTATSTFPRQAAIRIALQGRNDRALRLAAIALGHSRVIGIHLRCANIDRHSKVPFERFRHAPFVNITPETLDPMCTPPHAAT